MKRRIITLIIFCFSFCAANAQKENNIWLGGYESEINFNSGSPVAFYRPDSIDFDATNASICDKKGNLLFYTNGYYVMNKNFQLMQNGDSLNIGDYASFGYDLLADPDGTVIIPFPSDSNKYYIFHPDNNYVTYDTFDILMPTHLFYDVVDMSLDSGLGGIVAGQKDIVILSDTLTNCGMKAVKHANGRDYWLLFHKHASDIYYRFLIDPYGIHGPYTQEIGYVYYGNNENLFSILIFNKDGSMAAQLSAYTTSVQLYDFDRCTGEFSDLINFNVSDTSYYVVGGAFSPSGRYFYADANYWDYLWQFDLTAPNIFASRKFIAKYDGVINPEPTNFYEMRLGPDDKIYIHSYDWVNSIHVINEPDSSGTACGFVENAITINPPGYNWNSFPNTVNYSLGALPGPCDTLTGITQLPQPVFTWGVYPNPFVAQLNISITGAATNAEVIIYNLLGEKLYENKLTPNNYFINSNINLSSLAAGMYIVTVNVNGKQYERKVVKQSE